MISKEKESTTVSIRIDKDLKKVSEELLDELGLNLSSAFTMFLKQSVREKGIPFNISLNMPNAKTMKAIEEAYAVSRDKNAKTYKNLSEILEEIGD